MGAGICGIKERGGALEGGSHISIGLSNFYYSYFDTHAFFSSR